MVDRIIHYILPQLSVNKSTVLWWCVRKTPSYTRFARIHDMRDGIILIDKPKGITSYDVLRRLKREANDPKRKLGHAGTLDPLASGLMVVGVGTGTKQLSAYVGLPKTYEAVIRVGVRTDTGDIEGTVLEEVAEPQLVEAEVREILLGMVGTLRIPAPVYSAIKRGGEALYKKARRGEYVKPPLREMEVRSVSDIFVEAPRVRATFVVGSGTYIRSLAEELGRRSGYPATLEALRRTRVGELKIEDARPI